MGEINYPSKKVTNTELMLRMQSTCATQSQLMTGYEDSYVHGWNACIDAMKGLNRDPVKLYYPAPTRSI